MLTGIVTILGMLAGLAPSIVQFLSLKANNAQAIELRKLEIEAAKQNIALQVDLANVNADIEQQRHIYSYAAAPSGIKWVDALAVFVRPYITLVMFHGWLALEGMLCLYAIANGVPFGEMIDKLWGPDVQSLFAAIIGFWFGDRSGKRGVAMAATLAVTNPRTMLTNTTPAPSPNVAPPRRASAATDFIADPPGSR